MATFSVINADEAPARPRPTGRLKHRMAEYDDFVAGVKKGQVGKLTPADGETARAVATRVSRAGTRVGKGVHAWVVEGVVYFKLR